MHGVNALLPDQTLSFAPNGLTIVYGDNGSGKSGYARLIREAVTARVKRNLLGNVYRPERTAPTATFAFTENGHDRRWSLTSSANRALSSVRFYDEECGDAYVTRAAEVSYRPSALTILDGLSAVCVAMQQEIDRRLSENKATRQALPALPEQTQAAAFLATLSGATTDHQIEDALHLQPDHDAVLAAKLTEEVRLGTSDPRKEQARLTRLADDYAQVIAHTDRLTAATGTAAVDDLEVGRDRAQQLRAAATVASAATFDAEPVPGVGSATWRALWDAARRFAATDAHEHDFPATGLNARCMLCHQVLAPDAASRLHRFQTFMTDTTERDATAAERALASQVKNLDDLIGQPPAVTAALGRLLAAGEPVEAVDTTMTAVLAYVAALRDWLTAPDQSRPPGPGASIGPAPLRRLTELRQQAEQTTTGSYDMTLTGLQREIRDLQAVALLNTVAAAVRSEVTRLAAKNALTAARRRADTTGITRKTTELTTAHVTAIVRDHFTRETERLHLDRVTLNPTGGRRNTTLQHQPALLGAETAVEIDQVLSEGEQTALGLAGFLTEAHFDQTRSAIVLDDPVSSLDSKRRTKVAERIVQLAADRQVIVFSHDAPFINALNRQARDQVVSVTQRTIARLGNQPGHVTDKHPWHVKDVPARIDELEVELGRIKKARSTLTDQEYADRTYLWAGKLSQAWERAINIGIVYRVVDPGTNEVKVLMFKLLVAITADNERDLQAGYGRTSEWAARHDQALELNFAAPEPDELEHELTRFKAWFKLVSKYGT